MTSSSAYLVECSLRRGNRFGFVASAVVVGLLSLLTLTEGLPAQQPADDSDAKSRGRQVEFFENRVRPVLVQRCTECHGADVQESGLRVDRWDDLLKGGDRGPAVVPGNAAQSLLVQVVRHADDLAMPPDEPLSSQEIASLQQWIDEGAVWPADVHLQKSDRIDEAAKDHWAFQRLQPVAPPEATDAWVRNPVDAFVLKSLREAGLSPSAEADRRTLIRRLTYSVTGLPPTYEQVADFVADPDPLAYEKRVDRLLASPAYGEHWARHWLDVARYSDTKGYVYAREERFWTHAWTYRDWVVGALNDDLPYDRFLLLQIAADQVPDGAPDDLAAMGFLTLGRRFLGVRRDVIDDRIDVVCRGTMGLTVSCARCHDHKYDPIPTSDYYSLYGVFDSCVEEQKILSELASDTSFRGELEKRQAKLASRLEVSTREAEDRMRSRIADYLFAQSELEKFPADGFDQVFQTGDLLPAVVRGWSRFLRASESDPDSLFWFWHQCCPLPADGFAQAAAERIEQARSDGHLNPLLMQALDPPPGSFRECCDRYGQVFAEVDRQWHAALDQASTNGTAVPGNLPDPDAEEIRQVLYGDVLNGVPGPCRVPAGPIAHAETYVDTDSLTELWKLQGEVDRWLNQSPEELRVAMILKDQATPIEPRVFLRGNSLKLGKDVTRQFLSLLRGGSDVGFRQGSGRLELAQAIVDPQNPLTARVMVNRVWAYHIGKGLVPTESDFGLRSEDPSHPELLDWLATEFVSQHWSLKQLHRTILMSATFRQASFTTSPSSWQHAVQVDPENRLLWRMNPRRLTFEEMRDSLLQANASIDRRMGGRPADLFQLPFPRRRTLYGLVDRQFFASALRVFDVANPDLHMPRRNETTVPQQALFFLNHPLVLENAKALARLVRSEDPAQGVARMYQQVLQRDPEPVELADAMGLLQHHAPVASPSEPTTGDDWTYGLGEVDEERHLVSGFQRLSYFSDEGWRGGPTYPDRKLGWVQLSATGGHPGNTRQHAAVRRWTAPQDMSIAIRSHWTHEPEAGDGVRVFLIGSSPGVFESVKLHHDQADLDVAAISVNKGDTIDFVVDIDEVLNSDQYRCRITIERTATGESSGLAWNSESDFPGNQLELLDAWEQLAQVLFCTNEFLFVD